MHLKPGMNFFYASEFECLSEELRQAQLRGEVRIEMHANRSGWSSLLERDRWVYRVYPIDPISRPFIVMEGAGIQAVTYTPLEPWQTFYLSELSSQVVQKLCRWLNALWSRKESK